MSKGQQIGWRGCPGGCTVGRIPRKVEGQRDKVKGQRDKVKGQRGKDKGLIGDSRFRKLFRRSFLSLLEPPLVLFPFDL